jgi:hypothetical protein
MIFGNYRRVTTVDSEAGVHAGQRAEDSRSWEFPAHDVRPGEWALWLPHDCDEWIIAHGTATEVLEAGRRFRDAIDAALAHIEEQAAEG